MAAFAAPAQSRNRVECAHMHVQCKGAIAANGNVPQAHKQRRILCVVLKIGVPHCQRRDSTHRRGKSERDLLRGHGKIRQVGWAKFGKYLAIEVKLENSGGVIFMVLNEFDYEQSQRPGRQHRLAR